jgi:hypothetical protein
MICAACLISLNWGLSGWIWKNWLIKKKETAATPGQPPLQVVGN